TFDSPSALRVIDSTTKIFENDVHSSSSAGATDSTVSPSRMTIELLGLLPGALFPSLSVTLTEPTPGAFTAGAVGAVGATGPPGAAAAGAAPNSTASASTRPARAVWKLRVTCQPSVPGGRPERRATSVPTA